MLPVCLSCRETFLKIPIIKQVAQDVPGLAPIRKQVAQDVQMLTTRNRRKNMRSCGCIKLQGIDTCIAWHAWIHNTGKCRGLCTQIAQGYIRNDGASFTEVILGLLKFWVDPSGEGLPHADYSLRTMTVSPRGLELHKARSHNTMKLGLRQKNNKRFSFRLKLGALFGKRDVH